MSADTELVFAMRNIKYEMDDKEKEMELAYQEMLDADKNGRTATKLHRYDDFNRAFNAFNKLNKDFMILNSAFAVMVERT